MGAGDGFTQYRGHNFLTVVEAQWAVFFQTMGDPWHYDSAAELLLANPKRYLPQFSLPRLGAYLEMRCLDDYSPRQVLHHYHQDIEEPVVYLAVGDLPDQRQLSTTGWWDSTRSQGVMKLTPGFDWEKWFPPDYPPILQAIEVARTEEFESTIPQMRQSGEEVRDIPEREREEPPERS